MTGASVETTLELWAASLRDVKERMRPLFSHRCKPLHIVTIVAFSWFVAIAVDEPWQRFKKVRQQGLSVPATASP